MKIKRFFILSIFVLAILMIGAVSANDNVTGEVISTDDADDDALAEEIPHSLMGEDWPSEIEIDCRYGQNNILKDVPIYFVKTISGGKIDVSIDGEKRTAEYDGGDEVDEVYRVPTTGLPLGEHVLNVKITNDSYFRDVDRNFTFYIKDLVVDVPKNVVADGVYKNEMQVKLNSEDSGNLVVAIDDENYTYNGISKENMTFSLDNLSAFGNPHIIKVVYTTANGVVYNETYVVNITYFRMWDNDIRYRNEATYSFTIPEGFSKDKVHVTVDGRPCNFNQPWSINHNAEIAGLGLGNHTIVVSYDGDDNLAKSS